MTPIPARLLRRQTESCRTRPAHTARDAARRAFIIEAAGKIFAAHGRQGVTLANFADAVGMSAGTIRRHFCDMHHLFGYILTQHLDGILAAIGQVPHGRPDGAARRRAEYFRVTRDHAGLPTKMHVLLTKLRFALPQDELEPLDIHRRMIGALVGGDAVLDMLDCATMDLGKIEAATAAFAAIDNARQVAADASEAAMPVLRKTTGMQKPVRPNAARMQTLPHISFRTVPQAAPGRYVPLHLDHGGMATPPRYAHQSGP